VSRLSSGNPTQALAPDLGRGLTPLLDTVAEEARRQVEALLAEARRLAELRVREAEKNAKEIVAQATASGAVEGEREAQRRIALAGFETRRELLRVRESQIERAIELATRRLAERAEGAAGACLLAAAIRTAASALGEPRVRVRVRPRDHAALESALGADFVWEDDEREEPGVRVLSPDGRRMVDMTVGGILRRRRDDARRAAAAALFETGS